MPSDGHRGNQHESSSNEQQLSDFLADYIERLTAGEKIEPEEILAEHPTLGPTILEELAWIFLARKGEGGKMGLLRRVSALRA